MKDITYLAIPYSHSDPRVRELRFEIANFVSAKLMQMGEVVFSPISHSHPMVEYGIPSDWEYWKSQDESFLNVCSKLKVVVIDGWIKSRGVHDEIVFMKKRGVQIEFVDPSKKWGTEFELFVEEVCNRLGIQ
jgi:hypothetical protein